MQRLNLGLGTGGVSGGSSASAQASPASSPQQSLGEHQPARARPSPPNGLASRLPRSDLELAGYLTARHALGRPVSPHVQQLLVRANDSKKDVLELMRFGRSNVASDLAATGNAGAHRRRALRAVAGGMSSVEVCGEQAFAMTAGMAAYVGAGNCGEFANVAAHVHTGRLEPGEQLVIERLAADPQAPAGAGCADPQRELPHGDHAWARIQASAEAGGASAILDVWGDGPPIEPVDARFANRDHTAVETVHTIDHESAGAIHREFQSHLNGPPSSAVRRLNAVITAQMRRGSAPDTVHEPEPIVAHSFAQGAASAIAGRRQDPALARIAAAAAQGIGASAAQAAAAAPAIVDIAQDLLAVHPRELSREPGFVGAPQDSSDESDG